MKKKIVFAFIFLVIVLISWMGYLSIQNLKKKSELGKNQSELSSILVSLGQPEIDADRTTVLVFFNSECEICHWEMEQFSEHLSRIEKYQLLLTSYEPKDEALQFLEKYNLSKFYLNANPGNVMSTFSGGVPQVFIYQKGTLKNNFKGEVRIDAILNSIKP